jgi:DNA-binding NtrC family response regulator
MALFPYGERGAAEALGRLVHTNPFLPEWVEAERRVLGAAFRPAPAVYSRDELWESGRVHPNVLAVAARVERLVTAANRRLAPDTNPAELARYQDIALYHLYLTHGGALDGLRAAAGAKGVSAGRLWPAFLGDFERLFPPGLGWDFRAERVFAVFFQMRRAFVQIYENIIGGSRPAARLRAAAWQSVFTHDLRRYYRSLHARMRGFPTLITGASGTGKELVARAVGLSQYVPFDPEAKSFPADFGRLFFALNLSALAPTLLESELFGHCKGAFTGAVAPRAGWLEQCDPHGAVFLDEVGEVDPAVQVKLLRVLQTRAFERLGETTPREFRGKLLAATNRDLAAEARAGRFRHDFFYRLCADQVATPTLREQLDDRPEDLANLVRFLTREALGGPADGEAEELAAEVAAWVESHLPPRYPWPGNFRELGHCVRSVIIRRDYRPLGASPPGGDEPARALAEEVAACSLTAADLQRRYFALVLERAGSYEKAARRLGVDWRTLRGRLGREKRQPRPSG